MENTYKTITNLDVVNPALNFLSEVKGVEEIGFHPTPFKKSNSIVNGANQTIEYNIEVSSRYFFNSEENKIFTAIQQIIETSKEQNKIDQIITDKEYRVFRDNLLIDKEEQKAYIVKFDADDIMNVLNVTKKTEKESINRRIDNLIKKLDYLMVSIEKNNITTKVKKQPAATQLYKITTTTYINKVKEYEVETSPLDFWNIRKSQNYDCIINEEFSECKSIKQFTTKPKNQFLNLKGIEINIANFLLYNFYVNKSINNYKNEIKVEDLVFQMYKHQQFDRISDFNDEIQKKMKNKLKERKKYLRQKLKTLIPKLGETYNIEENKGIIKIEHNQRKKQIKNSKKLDY